MFFELFIIIPTIAIIVTTILIIFIIKNRSINSTSNIEDKKKTSREILIKEANKKLAQNPNNPTALLKLANLYYEEKDFTKSCKLYGVLLDVPTRGTIIDRFDITIKRAISALNIKDYKTAYNDFLVARNYHPDDFQINYNLGFIEYLRKRYERACGYLVKAKEVKSGDSQTYVYLGLSLLKLNKYDVALNVLNKAISLDPDNKEALFAIGECNYNLGKNEEALNAFSELKDDPNLSANACIYSGIISMRYKKYNQAIVFLKRGLENRGIPMPLALELKYNLANCYIKKNEISKAISPLEDIIKINKNYKDAEMLLNKYQELDSNHNLRVFLIGERDHFITLCESLISAMFPKSKISIKDVNTRQREYTDITATIKTNKTEKIILFRFLRTSGQVGELLVRDFFGKIKDTRAEKSICLTAGTFSKEAKSFVEARLIDLIDKNALLKLLKNIHSK